MYLLDVLVKIWFRFIILFSLITEYKMHRKSMPNEYHGHSQPRRFSSNAGRSLSGRSCFPHTVFRFYTQVCINGLINFKTFSNLNLYIGSRYNLNTAYFRSLILSHNKNAVSILQSYRYVNYSFIYFKIN